MRVIIKVVGSDEVKVRVNKTETDFWFTDPAKLRLFVMRTRIAMRAKGHTVELKRVTRKMV